MRRRASRADRRELVARRIDGLGHPLAGVNQKFVDQLAAHVETTVPTRSPDTIRKMLASSSMLKTWIGRWLSMQSDNAVESITARPRCSASKCVISGMNFASGL